MFFILQSTDADQRKLAKQSLDTSGNLYQYDNYDEVAMDTDSETNSPGKGDEQRDVNAVDLNTFQTVMVFMIVCSHVTDARRAALVSSGIDTLQTGTFIQNIRVSQSRSSPTYKCVLFVLSSHLCYIIHLDEHKF